MKILEDRGLASNTLVVFMGDVGQGMSSRVEYLQN